MNLKAKKAIQLDRDNIYPVADKVIILPGCNKKKITNQHRTGQNVRQWGGVGKIRKSVVAT